MYALPKGEFNYNKTPIAPPGTKALVYTDPTQRGTWETHATDAWYLGPAMQHYRCFRFWVPSTKGIRIAQTANFFLTYCKMPALANIDKPTLAAQ